MNFISPSRKRTNYDSKCWLESTTCPGVRYAVKKPSLESRLVLVQKVRELSIKHEFLKAGDIKDQLEATVSELLVGKLYLEWGLLEIQGLTIDGAEANVDNLIRNGPEPLADEIVSSIKAGLQLTEQERKNF